MSTNMPKAQRREAAREEARKLRDAQAAREKRNRNLLIGGVIALIVIVAIAVFAIVREGNKPAIENVAVVPANTTLENGGVSLGADLVAGTANEGAPVIDVYLDFTCPHCATFEEVNGEAIDELVAAGEATVVYHPMPWLSEPDWTNFSARATNAVAVVADQAPEAYNAFQRGLFELFAGAAGTEPTDEQIATTAVEAGVPQEVADTFTDREFIEWGVAAREQFQKDGYRGTPTVLIDGKEFEGWTEPGGLAEAVNAA
ncbi:disulfide bond formation protein DsbA [Georgenia yuyongxinii]|uniref:Disulfide bond formation protein DsbA n=1 Tax=Georgenia yuyongxinii TaxID=2589797 RepID=A0A5B8C2Z1_9MICO|nr:thioredoxin domain-containing protein [Georgenia yuyongxinii]QDC23615.1 disulfide bond formation protein DsbA [Georgenia yuyongxinii]